MSNGYKTVIKNAKGEIVSIVEFGDLPDSVVKMQNDFMARINGKKSRATSKRRRHK